MIEELFLPDGSQQVQLAPDTFTGPLLPCPHEGWQRFVTQLRRTKEMHVIRHDDIAADRPAMAIMRVPPFVDQDTGNFV